MMIIIICHNIIVGVCFAVCFKVLFFVRSLVDLCCYDDHIGTIIIEFSICLFLCLLFFFGKGKIEKKIGIQMIHYLQNSELGATFDGAIQFFFQSEFFFCFGKFSVKLIEKKNFLSKDKMNELRFIYFICCRLITTDI